jgi:hypothetical protein
VIPSAGAAAYVRRTNCPTGVTSEGWSASGNSLPLHMRVSHLAIHGLKNKFYGKGKLESVGLVGVIDVERDTRAVLVEKDDASD